MKKQVRFIDLFAGIGGTRIGFEQACSELNIKSKCVFSSEIKNMLLRHIKQTSKIVMMLVVILQRLIIAASLILIIYWLVFLVSHLVSLEIEKDFLMIEEICFLMF